MKSEYIESYKYIIAHKGSCHGEFCCRNCVFDDTCESTFHIELFKGNTIKQCAARYKAVLSITEEDIFEALL